MSGFIIKSKGLLLFIGDIICLYTALYLTLALRFGVSAGAFDWPTHSQIFSLIFLFWLIVFYISDFYDLKGKFNNINLISNYAKAMAINGIIAVFAFYFLAPLFPQIKPQRILIIDLFAAFILLFAWRKIFFNLIKSPQISNRVLIIGASALAKELALEISRRPQLGYQAVSVATMPEDLKQYCLDRHIDVLVSSENLRSDAETARKIFDCLSLGVDILHINNFYEIVTQKIPVESIEMSWFLENLSENTKKSYEIAKRLLDIILAIFGLIVTAPLSPFIALIIKLESPGPIIFRQIRVGKNGKEFRAMKFRSMVADAEKNGAQWASKNDPRVTKFGRIMRMTRLDEIPQLWNILRGEMSLVGPRPERPEFVDKLALSIPFYKERLLAKPGLSGWAQLLGPAYGGSEAESLEKLKYDLYYIKNRSLLLDLAVMLKTIKVVLGGKGQ